MTIRKIEVLIPDTLEELPLAALGNLVAQGKELVKFFKAVDAYAQAQIEAGKTVPGWTLGPGRNSREWKSDEEAMTAMARQGINDPYEHILLSVAKAEKRVSNPDALKPAWENVPGKPTLKPASVSSGLVGAAKPVDYGF